MFINHIKFIVCLIFTFIGSIGIYSLFHKDIFQQPAAVATTSTAMLETMASQIEAQYHTAVDSLQQINNKLSQQVRNDKTALEQARQANKRLREKVTGLMSVTQQDIQTAGEKKAVEPDSLIAGTRDDSLSENLNADYDSLRLSVTQLIAAENEQDSLCQSVQDHLERQLNNKDSTLLAQARQYNALKLSFDNSLASQDVLAAQNTGYTKQIKRQHIRSKFLSAGIAALSAVTLYSLLRH